MKTIYLLRHAKSSWSNPTLHDFDRPLNKRGKRDASFMGKKLAEKVICPDIIISSPARRAKKTAKKVAKQIGYPTKKIIYELAIYESSESQILKIIHQLNSKYESVMLVGHNPELTYLSNKLSDEHIYNIPTAGISCLRFKTTSWKKISDKTGKQVFFDFPKRYTSK